MLHDRAPHNSLRDSSGPANTESSQFACVRKAPREHTEPKSEHMQTAVFLSGAHSHTQNTSTPL